jgi:hypothetical protein
MRPANLRQERLAAEDVERLRLPELVLVDGSESRLRLGPLLLEGLGQEREPFREEPCVERLRRIGMVVRLERRPSRQPALRRRPCSGEREIGLARRTRIAWLRLRSLAKLRGERILGLAEIVDDGQKDQGQTYCVCDMGLPTGKSNELHVPAGTYAGSFMWNGKNWNGPSDTMSPKGAAFPAGSYVLTVQGAGTLMSPDEWLPYEKPIYAIAIEIPITLVE